MSTNKDTWLDVIAKITKLTQLGEIVWKTASTDPIIKVANDRIKVAFETEYLGKKMRLYERSYTVTVHPPSPFQFNFGIEVRIPGEYWYNEIVLEILDEFSSPIFKFPETSMHKDLLFSVQYQVAEIKDYLDKILSKK